MYVLAICQGQRIYFVLIGSGHFFNGQIREGGINEHFLAESLQHEYCAKSAFDSRIISQPSCILSLFNSDSQIEICDILAGSINKE